MEKSDYEELEPLLKSKSQAEVTIPSNILQRVFCLFLLLLSGKDTKDKVKRYAHIRIYQFLSGQFPIVSQPDRKLVNPTSVIR